MDHLRRVARQPKRPAARVGRVEGRPENLSSVLNADGDSGCWNFTIVAKIKRPIGLLAYCLDTNFLLRFHMPQDCS